MLPPSSAAAAAAALLLGQSLGGLSMEHEQNGKISLGLTEVYTCRNNLLSLHNQCLILTNFMSTISVGLNVYMYFKSPVFVGPFSYPV